MGQLNIYILRRAFLSIGGLLLFALAVLLLERLLRIFEVVTSSSKPAGDASAMVVNLLPHYLGIAIPLALMLGTILTIDRISRSSELTAAFGAGISLFHITKPFLLIAAVLTALTFILEGYLQPIGRYGYNEVVNSISNNSTSAALKEGKFTEVNNYTLYAGTDPQSAGIGPIFIMESLESGALRITTAAKGDIIAREDTGQPVLHLEQGHGFIVDEDRTIQGPLEFQSSALAGTLTATNFRRRGGDVRELTSRELFANRHGGLFPNISLSANNAALHLRLARTYLLLLLPFIAVPFGINYGRNPSSAGIFVGVVSLLTLQKALEFGQSLGAKGVVAPWVGIWPLMGIVTLSAIFIFRGSAYKMGQPPLAIISMFIDDIAKDIRRGFWALIPSAFHPVRKAVKKAGS